MHKCDEVRNEMRFMIKISELVLELVCGDLKGGMFSMLGNCSKSNVPQFLISILRILIDTGSSGTWLQLQVKISKRRA